MHRPVHPPGSPPPPPPPRPPRPRSGLPPAGTALTPHPAHVTADRQPGTAPPPRGHPAPPKENPHDHPPSSLGRRWSRPMRVLLIGANGYLGRFVADRLLADPAVQLTAVGGGAR